MKRYSSHTMALWNSRSFPTLKRDWEESSRGKAAKSSTKTSIQTWWITKASHGVTPRATTTICEIERNLR